MKRRTHRGGRSILAVFMLCVLVAAPRARAFEIDDPSLGDFTVHAATSGNSNSNSTTIDHPLTNEDPDAIAFVTQNFNPDGDIGTYNDHNVGIWYSDTNEKWSVFNQDGAGMTPGTDYNLLVAASTCGAFVHTATSENSFANWTVIDHPLANNNPNAILTVTQNYNPGGGDGVYNDHAFGVWFDGSHWTVFNQDVALMPEGASFNVLVDPELDDGEAVDGQTLHGPAFVHTANTGNTVGYYTLIDHPLTNGDAEAVLIVTQSFNPGGVGGVYNDHNEGVWYDGARQQWSVFNQDLADMPIDAGFNVLLPGHSAVSFVHPATEENTGLTHTVLDHTSTVSNPDAVLFVTQNWNPGGEGGTYNDNTIAVAYVAEEWFIFNQDPDSELPVGSAYNILVCEAGENVLVHTARAENIVSNWTILDHPLSNGNPDALLTVTQHVTGLGIYNDRPIGVWYDGSHWAIFNQDLTAMPEGATFNVLIGAPPSPASLERSEGVAMSIHLDQNFPNPFGEKTNIRFVLPEPAQV
ncbi:MAG: hypothetical protein GF346_09925, partial [Candidatus Eisenbacteria bacterium]|nr:hypothetical protein [Candidatus Latescibacterota bacterium]MBD3302752.1 hypothetical protein [Candidatus Eisenbacteria bacterium]